MKNKTKMKKLLSSLAIGVSILGASIPAIPVNALASTPTATVTQVFTSGESTIFQMSDGTMKSFGANYGGQLGLGTVTPSWGAGGVTQGVATPTTAPALTGLNIKQLGMGNGFAVALSQDGTVKVWGENYSGALGLGLPDYKQQLTPATIPGLSGVKQIAVGSWHVLALMNDGTVKAWGSNTNSQLGVSGIKESNVPITVPGLSNVKELDVINSSNFAILNDGTVKAFGYNSGYSGMGYLGIGSTVYSVTTPVTVPALNGVKQFATSSRSVNTLYALMNDGTVKAWGFNMNGEFGLGNGNKTNSTSPITIPGLSNVKKVGASINGAVFLFNDGTVDAIGGALAPNCYSNGTEHIVPVNGLTGVDQIFSDYTDAFAVLNDGTIKSWGSGAFGSMGIGSIGGYGQPPTVIPNLKFGSSSTSPTQTAITDVSNLNTVVTGNLSSQSTINDALSKYNTIKQEVDALPDGTDKTTLENQLASDLNLINTAQATLDMNSAQTMANALSTANPLTQQAVTSAQTALTKATTEVSALASSTAKTNLQTEGQAVQETINEAQATLDMNSAKTLADGLSGNLSQDAISTAQSALDKANAEVSALADGTVKANLQAEVPAIQETINVAQGTLDVQNAEVSINQNDVNTAQTAIDKLPDGDVKTALQARIATVQDVIDATNDTANTETSLTTLNTTLATENLSPDGQPQVDALVGQFQTSLNSLEQESTQATTVINSIPSTNVSSLNSRVTDLKNRLGVVNGYGKSIKQIVNELHSNPNKGNGTLKDTTVKVELNSSTDLASQFKEALTTQLGSNSGLKWISINNTLGTIDSTGMFTALQNGVIKVTAYNDKGIVDIIVKVSER